MHIRDIENSQLTFSKTELKPRKKMLLYVFNFLLYDRTVLFFLFFLLVTYVGTY